MKLEEAVSIVEALMSKPEEQFILYGEEDISLILIKIKEAVETIDYYKS